MSVFIRKKGDKAFYDVRDEQCIGRECLRVHMVEHRSVSMNGSSRVVGRVNCCGRREYFGCPHPAPEYDKKLADQRHDGGMRVQHVSDGSNPSRI